ncbi:hypothetical protein OXYTRIMIC_752 [Oxytricha trifallax]|uniref:Uncharacterized protein n=1 Tax=Oxytricha trifallax TaxID=1172189 RepID=A0A073HZJ2_9SPIT|nr:hypothetical protein OXYTRIMIC_752 [Oxytricha trifallax]
MIQNGQYQPKFALKSCCNQIRQETSKSTGQKINPFNQNQSSSAQKNFFGAKPSNNQSKTQSKSSNNSKPVFKKAAALMHNSISGTIRNQYPQKASPFDNSEKILESGGESIQRIVHSSAANSSKGPIISQNLSSGSKFSHEGTGRGRGRGRSMVKIKQLQPQIKNQPSISSFTKKR